MMLVAARTKRGRSVRIVVIRRVGKIMLPVASRITILKRKERKANGQRVGIEVEIHHVGEEAIRGGAAKIRKLKATNLKIDAITRLGLRCALFSRSIDAIGSTTYAVRSYGLCKAFQPISLAKSKIRSMSRSLDFGPRGPFERLIVGAFLPFVHSPEPSVLSTSSVFAHVKASGTLEICRADQIYTLCE